MHRISQNPSSFLALSLALGLLSAGCRDSMNWRPGSPHPGRTSEVLSADPLNPPPMYELRGLPIQEDASDFAWRLFVALNWPASETERGAPDLKKSIGERAKSVVWETWKSPEEVFLEDGKRPPGWNELAGPLPPECTLTAQDFPSHQRPVPEEGDRQALRVLRENQAIGGTLTDQHSNVVRYEIRFNKLEFDYIVGNGFFEAGQQDKAERIIFPDRSMEIKAAWREMTRDDSDEVRQRFYRRRIWLYKPGTPATCRLVEVGLVGLHIIQKTPSRPQWVWATFEHIDNVPGPDKRLGSSGRTLPYSFHKPGCSEDECPPNQSTQDGRPSTVPTQVVRRVLIGEEAAKLNPIWQQRLARAAKGSPWQYYELIDAQWPSRPVQGLGLGEPTPSTVANTTMETYVEQSNCMGCHFTAKTANHRTFADFSFMLLEAKSSPQK
jgi:hypothetical protein